MKKLKLFNSCKKSHIKSNTMPNHCENHLWMKEIANKEAMWIDEQLEKPQNI